MDSAVLECAGLRGACHFTARVSGDHTLLKQAGQTVL